MSDLAAPFLALFEDDTLAFWCFAQLMQTARFNFRHDESGIRGQLASLMALLQVVDPVLYHRLRQIGAGEGLFAYRYTKQGCVYDGKCPHINMPPPKIKTGCWWQCCDGR